MGENKYLQEVLDILKEDIQLETGINLPPDEIKLQVNTGRLHLSIFGESIVQIDFDFENYDATDMALNLQDAVNDLKQEIIDAKISQINAASEQWMPAVKDLLKKLRTPPKLLEELDISIEQGDYNRMHWMSDEEAEQGLPPVNLHITDFEDFNFVFPLVVENPSEPVAWNKLENKLNHYLNG